MRFANLRCAVVALAAVVICAGCGSSKPKGTSADQYVRGVCSAITSLEHDVATGTSARKNSTASNAAQAKKAEQAVLTAVAKASDRAVSRIKAAGTPDIPGGKAVAGTIVNAFTEVRNAMRSAAVKAGSLPTDSPAHFTAAARELVTSVRNSLNNIDASGLSNPDLERAAVNEPACKSLSG